MKKYNFQSIEKKWQKRWQKEGIYEPNLNQPRKPFYNLMMFPYPSAEGLHVGNMYAFTGSDIYGRFKRMQEYDVFEPIGLDGFGIHSENYALKIGIHPMEQAKISEKRFYKQLKSIGNAFAWQEKIETYDPNYYKWTQWIFIQLFKNGLVYRKKQKVNWCPSCKTVLADEQTISGKCERCNSSVIKKELEQWFFKITNYAEKLLNNLEKLDWSEKVKIAQKNWIGKSEGVEINFELCEEKKPNFIILHSYGTSPEANFYPWLKKELESRGYKVQVPLLPHSNRINFNEKDEIKILSKIKFNENSVVIGHSLGAVVALKALELLRRPIKKLFLVGGFIEPKFKDKPRPFADQYNWKFDFKKIKTNAEEVKILHDLDDPIIPLSQALKLQNKLQGELIKGRAAAAHFTAKREPLVLRNVLDQITIFTSRPETIFGTTYLALSLDHPWLKKEIKSAKSTIKNQQEIKKYISKAQERRERKSVEVSEKSGIEVRGVKAVNPATKEKIPIWVADYVLAEYGTGAIMAVPAHDERDFEFAKKYNLPITIVICPNFPQKICPILDKAYVGDGYLINSGKFSGLSVGEAKEKIIEFVGGEKRTKYHLRDWLISRQRYWGAPIPLVFCSACKKRIKKLILNESKENLLSQKLDYSKGELDNPGWIAVEEKNLPVKLPFVHNFRPQGKGKSPLALVKSFYETTCPKCGAKARRETDVSDTFLDSAWYYIAYLMKSKKWRINFDDPEFQKMLKKWLPVEMYIGGAEHSVLHLLYIRFLAMALHDLNLIPVDEPIKRFRAHGLLIKEGAKMSKSKGNVVNPDEYIKRFGADALRLYLMFLAPFEEGGDFRDSGILGAVRFLERIWKLSFNVNKRQKIKDLETRKLEALLHQTIKKVTEDIENLKFNTAISALMIFLNELEKAKFWNFEIFEKFLLMLAPFAPHFTEEVWQILKKRKNNCRVDFIHAKSWPKYDPKLIKQDTFVLIIQINGKTRASVEIPVNSNQEEAEKEALRQEKIKNALINKSIKKVIYVPNKLINFVI